METVGPHASLALAITLTGVPDVEAHSALLAAGQMRTGGVESTTVTVSRVVSLTPCVSVTLNPMVCAPNGSVTVNTGPVPRGLCSGRPGSSSHSNTLMSSLVPGLESASLDAEPSRKTCAPPCLSHSI